MGRQLHRTVDANAERPSSSWSIDRDQGMCFSIVFTCTPGTRQETRSTAWVSVYVADDSTAPADLIDILSTSIYEYVLHCCVRIVSLPDIPRVSTRCMLQLMCTS